MRGWDVFNAHMRVAGGINREEHGYHVPVPALVSSPSGNAFQPLMVGAGPLMLGLPGTWEKPNATGGVGAPAAALSSSY